MEKPVNCDDDFYELMKKCWLLNSRKRISFLRLVEKLLCLLSEDDDDDNEFLQRFKINSFYFNQNLNEVKFKSEDEDDDEQNKLVPFEDNNTETVHHQNVEEIEIDVPIENQNGDCHNAAWDDTNKLNDIKMDVDGQNCRNIDDIELQDINRAP